MLLFTIQVSVHERSKPFQFSTYPFSKRNVSDNKTIVEYKFNDANCRLFRYLSAQTFKSVPHVPAFSVRRTRIFCTSSIDNPIALCNTITPISGVTAARVVISFYLYTVGVLVTFVRTT